MNNPLIILCILLWGLSAFLNRLAVEKLPPLLMQVVVGLVFIFYIPVALKMSGVDNPFNYKWSVYSIVLTGIATLLSIASNVMLYMTVKGSNSSGSTNMMVSLYPLVTLILTVIFLHEQLSFGKIMGVLAMIGGACLLTFC